MKLKQQYTNAEEIPSAHRDFYAERNGAWVLQVEGASTTAPLEELKHRVGALTAERDALHTRVADLEVTHAVLEAGRRHGLREAATPDLTARARQVFRLVEGAPRTFQPDG